MTREQLDALRNYITTRINLGVELRLNPSMPGPERWQIEAFERRFEEIMLTPAVSESTDRSSINVPNQENQPS